MSTLAIQPYALIKGGTYDEERAFYGRSHLILSHCQFDGPADGESAVKEARDIIVKDSWLNLRYPFWHDQGLSIDRCELTPLCRAALWYSKDITIQNSRLHGIKALRECEQVTIRDTEIVSPEFGWSTRGITMERSSAESEYFMMRSRYLVFDHVELNGKYSFQYIENAVFDHCTFNTKDAFWHGRHLHIKNSRIQGEYLGWYSEDVTFEHCTIIGTQPLCYCRNLRLIHCTLIDTDLAFEKSDVRAILDAPILSIKNPASGCIEVPAVQDIIMDDPNARGTIEINPTLDSPSPAPKTQEDPALALEK